MAIVYFFPYLPDWITPIFMYVRTYVSHAGLDKPIRLTIVPGCQIRYKKTIVRRWHCLRRSPHACKYLIFWEHSERNITTKRGCFYCFQKRYPDHLECPLSSTEMVFRVFCDDSTEFFQKLWNIPYIFSERTAFHYHRCLMIMKYQEDNSCLGKQVQASGSKSIGIIADWRLIIGSSIRILDYRIIWRF